MIGPAQMRELWAPYRRPGGPRLPSDATLTVVSSLLRHGERHTSEIAKVGVTDAPRVLGSLVQVGLVERREGKRSSALHHARYRSFYRLTPKGERFARAMEVIAA
jgi:DNA-binding MarR family transcriptional regulator